MKQGFVNVDKPSGVSSGFVVNRVKRLCGMPCGHMGTLDPLASGVLPVAIGNAARLFDYMQRKKKQYIAVFRFGVRSDTLDCTGEVTCVNAHVPGEAELSEQAATMTGLVMQVPPKYSAKNVNGRRSYQLAREGKDFELAPKEVQIDRIELLGRVSPDSYRFRIDCGAGTYIRSIARDLAASCGADAIMTELVRTRSGPFFLEEAVPLDLLTAENLRDFTADTEGFVDLPLICVADAHIFNGLPQPTDEADGLYRIHDREGFYGIAEVKGHMAKIKTKLC